MKEKQLIFDESKQMNGFERFNLVGDPKTGNLDMDIANIRLSDSGVYKCMVMGDEEENNLIANATLTVSPEQLDPDSHGEQQSTKTRGIPNSALKLSAPASSPFSSLQQPVNPPASKFQQQQSPDFITPYYTAPIGYQSHRGHHQTSGFQFANYMLLWPYLLMLVATILFLANIYLIYSLVKRNRKNNRNSNKQQQQTAKLCGQPCVCERH